MVFTSLSLPILLGVVGLALDAGYLRSARRRMQTAADAAAVAGASELLYGDGPTWAQNDAATNGFTNGANNVTVTVNIPPTSGPNAGNSNFVEVLISQSVPTYFMRALGINSATVKARAVAGNGTGPTCMYALDPSASSAFSISGTANVTAGCALIVDSNNSSALSDNGSNVLSDTANGVVGGYSTTGGATITPTPITGIVPAPDPLGYLPAPTVGACTATNYSLNGGKTDTIGPGTYCGGISLNGGSTLNLTAGEYILLGGGLSVNGGANIIGNGVSFYVTGNTTYPYAAVNLNGGATTSLTAPTTGSMAGILFFQDRSIASPPVSSISANASTVYTGAFYFPTSAVNFSGGASTSSPYTIIVAKTLSFSGNSTLNANYSSLPDGSPIKTTVLYE